ncbi:hypothetical protein [Rheinheimera aquimaris]|uniref:hypothetical protein n=1 Tax=Rheinheimera aquimaris TaxID=412437 RepID=UPI001E4CF2AB|nr:hypothetical protein [Rheinheimera aquimaris]MCD1599912.1 hypothetical protein [Rheinheimera aquimaris]
MTRKLTPKEWLNNERATKGFSGASQIDRKWIDHLVSKVPIEDQPKTREIWLSRIGKTVGEIHDEQMEEYERRFEVVLSEEELAVSNECYFGIMPTREFNAYTGRTPWGDRVIILHDALTHIIAIWCHWYSRSSEEGRNTLNTDERRHMMLEYFVGVWNEIPVSQKTPDIYPSSKDQWSYSESLAIACMNFVMGHELGHVLHDHKAYGPEDEKNHLMEYQADEKGVEICVKMFLSLSNAKLNDYADSYLVAPFVSLGIISLFGNESSPTHPSVTMRKDKVIEKMNKMLRFGENQNFDKCLIEVYWEAEQMLSIFAGYASEIKALMLKYKNLKSLWLHPSLTRIVC